MAPNASAMLESLCEESRGRAMRESDSVSTQVSETEVPPGTRSIKVRSKVALCARTGSPPTNSARAATASFALGAPLTSSSVIEVRAVISSGIEHPGSTKV